MPATVRAPVPERLPHGLLGGLAVLVVAWHLVLYLRTPVPGEDGVSYLWMAERFAAADWHAGFGTVFPPGLSLLLAPCLALGVPGELAAWLLSTAAVVAALWPVAAIAARLAQRQHRHAALAAAVLFATSPLLGRLSVEVFSEPAFLVLMAWGTWFGLGGRTPALGICAALAFWIRPEGALLAPAMALAAPTLREAARRLALATAVTLVGVLLLALCRWLAGHDFDPLPIHGFHATRDELGQRGALLANLLDLPGPWLEAFGVSGLLALAALGAGLWPLRAAALLQVAVVLTFVVRRRFFVSAAVAVHGLAALAWLRLPTAGRWAALSLAALHALLAGWNGGIDADRAVDRALGRYLQGQLGAAGRLVSDLPRVVYFAGRQPPEPRLPTLAQLAAQSRADAADVVVLGRRLAAEHRAEPWPDWRELSLPDFLASACAQRGLLVLARRRVR